MRLGFVPHSHRERPWSSSRRSESPPQAAIDSESSRICRADHPCLLSSPEVFTCKQTAGGCSLRLARLAHELQQLERVDRMNPSAPVAVFS